MVNNNLKVVFIIAFFLYITGCSTRHSEDASYHSIQQGLTNTYSFSQNMSGQGKAVAEIKFCDEFASESKGIRIFVDCDIDLIEPSLLDQLMYNFEYVVEIHTESVFSEALSKEVGFCAYLVDSRKNFSKREPIEDCIKLFFAAPGVIEGDERSATFINLQVSVVGTSFHEFYHFVTRTVYGGHDNSWLEEYRAYLYTYYIRTLLVERIFGSEVRMTLDVPEPGANQILQACQNQDDGFFNRRRSIGVSEVGGFFAGKFIAENVSSRDELESVIIAEIHDTPRRGSSGVDDLLSRFSYCH